MDRFESAIELLVVALDEICGLRAAVVKEGLRFHVTGKQVAVVEDVLECVNLERIIVMARGSPADVAFQIRLAEVWEGEDLLLQIREEAPVRLLAADFEGSTDVLKKMDMAELDDNSGVHRSRRQADGFVIVADKSLQVIAGVFEFGEELHECLVILRGCEHANRNVVSDVINAVDEGNLAVVAFDRYELSVHDQKAAEAFGIAVAERDLVVVRKSIQCRDDPSVRRINAFAYPRSECTNACALEMQ